MKRKALSVPRRLALVLCCTLITLLNGSARAERGGAGVERRGGDLKSAMNMAEDVS